jgi:hypothetical protein
VNTFENAASAEAAGALVTHSGPCGACSSAADLAVRFETMGGTLTEQAAICGVLHSVDPTSTIVDLTACFLKLGFTQECALLWAVSCNSSSIDNSCQATNVSASTAAGKHFDAANVAFCASECAPSINGSMPPHREGPPFCVPGQCRRCSNQFIREFNTFAGRYESQQNGGIVEEAPRNCTEYFSIPRLDPCFNSSATDTGGTAVNRSATSPTSHAGGSQPDAASESSNGPGKPLVPYLLPRATTSVGFATIAATGVLLYTSAVAIV